MSSATDHDATEIAARQLAQADGAQARGLEVLAYLLDDPDRALFSDAVVAHVRNMLADLAYQLLYARAEAVGTADCGTGVTCRSFAPKVTVSGVEHGVCP